MAPIADMFSCALLPACAVSSGLHVIKGDRDEGRAHVQGKVTISNDGATIMKLLDIVHPAAKVLVDISLSQDSEVRSRDALRSSWS